MNAFLASTIKRDSTVTALQEFIPGLQNKQMVYIPTAAHAEQGFGVWEGGGSWQVAQTLCDNITTLMLEDYRGESVITELEKADVIWFAGGCCGYLAYWLHACRINEHLERLFADRHYIGISVGSCVAGPSLKFMNVYKNGTLEPPAQYLPGLGMLDREFYPHYKPEERDKITAGFTGQGVYLVPDGEQVVVDNGEIRLSAGVEVFDKN